MQYHKTLDKQVQKTLSPKHLDDPAIQELLKLVNSSYISFNRDKNLSDHAYSVSEKEYQEVLNNLRIQMAAKEKAEQGAKAKSDFLSVMSHEIRTPLNAIIGLAHLLLQDELLPAQQENMKALNISADNLLNLINDVLDFGKIEEGKISLSERNIDLRRIAGNIRMANRLRAEERGNTLRLLIDPSLPTLVKGDEVRLGQVLNNLVSNAVKFTHNGFITIQLQLQKTDGEDVTIRFSVTDTGIGIKRDRQPFIFDRFTQASNEIGRQYGGSGLGLAIVKRLLELYNSKIELKSEQGVGSEFSFSITFKKGQRDMGDTLNQPSGQSDLSGISVLLVDDVDFNILVAEKMIANWNAKVDVAENGVIAVNKARQKEYDIILMDLQMPVMDGYSATRHIREFNTQVPIIALTASASPDIPKKIGEFGMNAYLTKPFKPTELFEIIRKHSLKKTTTPVLAHPMRD